MNISYHAKQRLHERFGLSSQQAHTCFLGTLQNPNNYQEIDNPNDTGKCRRVKMLGHDIVAVIKDNNILTVYPFEGSHHDGTLDIVQPKMTIKEVAETIGVSYELVNKRVKELWPDKMKNGVRTYLNESEVTAVKLRISENTSLATFDDRKRLIDMPKTNLEKQLIIQQAMKLQQDMILQLQDENEKMKPKADFYDQVTESEDTIDIGTASKVLNYDNIGRNKLFSILRAVKVLDKNNNPYQKYVDAEYFRCIESKFTKPDGSTCINIKTVVYQKGLDFIRKIMDKYINGGMKNE